MEKLENATERCMRLGPLMVSTFGRRYIIYELSERAYFGIPLCQNEDALLKAAKTTEVNWCRAYMRANVILGGKM